jgi:hypothetical protein
VCQSRSLSPLTLRGSRACAAHGRWQDERAKDKLRNHKARIHDGKTSKDFECPKCHKKFSNKSDLNRHDKTVHLKLRDHVCEVCGHKDDAKPALPENDMLPHQCELCEWRFPNLNFLAYHIKAKHC